MQAIILFKFGFWKELIRGGIRITMPVYSYRCLECGSWDQRVAGLDDDTAICTKCGGLMLRVADNILGPYFEEISNLLYEMKTAEG